MSKLDLFASFCNKYFQMFPSYRSLSKHFIDTKLSYTSLQLSKVSATVKPFTRIIQATQLEDAESGFEPRVSGSRVHTSNHEAEGLSPEIEWASETVEY